MYLDILLKFMGLEPFFSFDPFPNYRNKKYKIIKNIFNYLYTFIIILLLIYQPLLETILSIKFTHFNNVPITLFYYIVPIHYLISLQYFNCQRKKRIYESSNMDFLEKQNKIAYCMPEERTLLRSILMASLLIIQWSITLYIYMDKPDIYDYIPDKYKYWNDVIIITSILPGRTILVLNSHIFFFSFLQQLYKMKKVEKNLKKREWVYNEKKSMSILCYEIIDIRYTLSRLIQKIEYMYSSVTVIGGIVVGILIEYGYWDMYNITCVTLFVILQIIFLSIIYKISNTKEEILKVIYNRSFVFKYLIDSSDIKIPKKDNSTLEKEINYIMDIEEEDEENFVEKDLTMNDIKMSKNNMFSEETSPMNSSMEFKKNMDTILKNQLSLTVHNDGIILEQMYKKITMTNFSIEWIILNDLLSKDWEKFKVFGIEIDNGKVLVDSVSITCLFIASGSLMGFLTEFFGII